MVNNKYFLLFIISIFSNVHPMGWQPGPSSILHLEPLQKQLNSLMGGFVSIDIIKNGVNTADSSGITALMIFASRGSVINNRINSRTAYESVKELIEYGASVDTQNKYGLTALMYAVGQPDNDQLISLLLDHKADPNLKDNFGSTALMHFFMTEGNRGAQLTPAISDLIASSNLFVADNENRIAIDYTHEREFRGLTDWRAILTEAMKKQDKKRYNYWFTSTQSHSM